MSTLKRLDVLDYLKKGAVIEYSSWFGVANVKVNGEIVGRVNLNTFNSLYSQKIIKREERRGSESIYSLTTPCAASCGRSGEDKMLKETIPITNPETIREDKK
jgi:hypothetical protein